MKILYVLPILVLVPLFVTITAHATFVPPVQQVKSGATNSEIICKDGLYLAIKINHKPVCLRPSTISILASRGLLDGADKIPGTVIVIPPGSENPASNNTYSPRIATVVIGINNTVTWINQSDVADTITPDVPIIQDGKSFGSISVIKPNDTYQFTFTEPGTYNYHTEPHPWMKATIIVLPQIQTSQETVVTVTLGEGQREGSLLAQKILQDSVQGLNFREYPLATNTGYPVTLHVGDTASNGCTVEMTLVKIDNKTATFVKKVNLTRLCPICLSENTKIDTPNGQVNVKDLKVGMQVFTQDKSGKKQIVTISKTGKTLSPPEHMMVHLVLEDEREIYASQNHPTSDGRLFGNLVPDDILDGSKVKSIKLVLYNGAYTYDILPSGDTGNYWANGILVGSTLK